MAGTVTVEALRARHELRERLRDTLKAVRLFKHHAPPSTIPAGMVGILATIAAIADHPEGPAPVRSAGCHLKDLATHNALDPSTVSRAVAALVRLGLVQRSADPTDGRATFLALTPRGAQALDETHRWYDDLLAEALRDWSPAELTAFAAMLHRFSADVVRRTDRGRTSADRPNANHADADHTNADHTDLEAAR
jgi:DNA-binding MarR family transcriptional regulator